MDDWQLLNEYATRNSEEAFQTLVDRYAGMVYHAALRQTGNHDAAQEVTQAVFIALAQKAGKIPRQVVLCGWLFRATRFAVLNLLRDEACRRRHEQEASSMDHIQKPDDTDSIWEQVSPLLDDALDRLAQADREIVMIRFFGNKSHKEAALTLGITEDTAKKRLSRAVEKLRTMFAKRGVVVPAITLVAALTAHGAKAAPAGLIPSTTAAAFTKGTVGTASALVNAKEILRLMAWAKAKVAMAVGAGLLLAAGTTTMVINSVSPQSNDLVGQLQHQSRKRIVADKHLALPATLDAKNLPLEQALDQIAVQAYAYWTIDYAVYSTEKALQQLIDVLQEGSELQTGGWTNLSGRILHTRINLQMGNPHGRSHGGFSQMLRGGDSNEVAMTVVLGPEASAKWSATMREKMQQGEFVGPPPADGPFQTISKAMRVGVNEGVLLPERLLAEANSISKLALTVPQPATPDAAARLAKLIHGKWITIYTLRKSPVDGAGIKLVHTGAKAKEQPLKPFDSGSLMSSMSSNKFNLTPEDRAAHDRAVEAYKQHNH